MRQHTSMVAGACLLVVGVLTTGLSAPIGAAASGFGVPRAEPATAVPKEVVAKVRKAAALLAKHGPAGIDLIRDPGTEFSWKDSYVFVVNCEADEVLANPAFPGRQGGDIKQHTDYDGKYYGSALCDTAQSGGGWIEYVWLKPGGETPLRKVSYVLPVEGRPYQVGAGVYDEHVTLGELTAISEIGS